MSKNLNQKARVFFDTETTGLNSGEHEIIQVGIVRIEPDGTRTVYQTKIKPVRLETAQPKALEINGFTADAWADAPYFTAVADTIVGLLKGSVIIGHNIPFDIGFLEADLKAAGRKGFGHHKVDTMTVAYEHLSPIGLDSMALDKIRDYLGWSRNGAHTALHDAVTCERLYNLLANSGFWTRTKIRISRRMGWPVK